MTLPAHQEALLRELGHFVDTVFAEQVRAIFVAGNNAEARLEAVRALVRKWSGGGGPGDFWTSRIIAALSVAPQPEPDEREQLRTLIKLLCSDASSYGS